MRRLLFLFFVVAICSIESNAQTSVDLTWLNGLGSKNSGNDIVKGSFVDASGNIYITGQIADTTDFDLTAATNTLQALNHCFVAKYSSGGTLVWAKVLNGLGVSMGNCVGVDGSGNVYLSGSFSGGSINFDPFATNVLLSPSQNDMFIAKYNSSGVYQWAYGVGQLSSNVTSRAMKVQSNGDIIVGGSFNAIGLIDFNPATPSYTVPNAGSNDGFVAKYNNLGVLQWAFNIGDVSGDYVTAVDADAAGNVYFAGDFQGTPDFDPSASTYPIASTGMQDFFYCKFTITGTLIWAKNLGGTLGDGVSHMKLDNLGNLILTGYMQSTDFDADPLPTATVTLNKVGGGLQDMFVGKYDNSNGNYLWAKTTGNSNQISANDVAIDALNNVYITGQFNATTDFDFSAANYTLTPTITSLNDVFLAKYSSAAGQLLFADHLGGPTSPGSAGATIFVDNTNNIVLTGTYGSYIDLDFSVASNTVTAYGGMDIFFSKYSQCITADAPTVAVTMQTMCANSVATLSISGGNLNSATNWVWASLVCGSGTVGVGTTTTVQPVFLTQYFVRGEGGCTSPGPCASATVDVAPLKGITGTVTTGAAIPVPGLVQLFRYEGALTKWDSVTYQNVNATGIYSFNAVNSASYIIMCIPTATDMVKTYAPNNSTWKNATIFSHGCVVDYNINIDVVPITTLTPGPGVLAGKIVEGVNYGGKGTAISPGNPIGGLTIKGGKNPGGGIVAQGKTAGDGTYTLSGLSLSGVGETYYVFVDIPGVDTAGTHYKAITSGTTSYTDLDFVVDSDYVRPIDYTAIKELNLDGELVKVYPNPAKDLVYIKLDAKNESNISLELYDMFGKKIMSQNYSSVQSEFKTGIDVAKLNRGIYFVKIRLNSGEARIKLVLTE